MVSSNKNEFCFSLFVLSFVDIVSNDERKARLRRALVVTNMIDSVYSLRCGELLIWSGGFQQRTKIVKDNS